jgi:hypothetical protein
MLRRSLSCTLLTLAVAFTLVPASAHAGITEISQRFEYQTGLISATPIMAAPATDGTYIIMASLSAGTQPVFAQFQWQDPDSGASFAQYSLGTPIVMRVAAGSAPTVQTVCGADGGEDSCSAPYSLFVVGLGLWPGQPQGQGGISKPISRDQPALTDLISGQVLLTPEANGTYMISIDLMNVNGGAGGAMLYSTISWIDEFGPESATVNAANGTLPAVGNVWVVHALGGHAITLSTGLISGTLESYDLHIRGIRFGTPSSGHGPLADTEVNLADRATATYPKVKTVLTVRASAEYLLAAYIASATGEPCDGTTGVYELGEQALLYGNGAQIASLQDFPFASPSFIVLQTRLLASTGFRFLTSNPCAPIGGAGPEYSMESTAIRF